MSDNDEVVDIEVKVATEEEDRKEEEQEAEEPPPPVYNCPCHCCDDDSIVPASVGSVAPNFHIQAILPSGKFHDFELSNFVEDGKWLLMVTVPIRDYHINSSMLVALSNNYQRFEEIGCNILAVIPENLFVLNAWCTQNKKEGGIGFLHYPFGSDLAFCIHKRYGLMVDNMILRGIFLIDPDKIIRHMSINDPNIGISIEELIRIIKAYQFAREHGEVCPAQWKEGDEAIKPTVAESKRFFGNKYDD